MINDPKLLIAVVSLITAIFSAIISFLNTRNSIKSEARYKKELELLKHELEKKKNFSEFPKEYAGLRLKALDSHINSIQTIKDNLSVIMAATGRTLDVKSAIAMIHDERLAIFKVYQSTSMNLEQEDLKPAHDAKTVVFKIETMLVSNWSKKIFIHMDIDEVRIFTDLKNDLTDFQNALRDNKYQTLYKY